MSYYFCYFVFLAGCGWATYAFSAPYREGLSLLYKMNLKKKRDPSLAVKETFRTIAWLGYMMIYQKIVKNVVVIQRGEYDVHYIYNGQLYKIKIKSPRGPGARVLQIINENDEDVTSELTTYLGPKHNFHGLLYRPKDFGYKELHFNLSNGECKDFIEENLIVLGG